MPIGIVIIVGIILAMIILHMGKTTVKDAHEHGATEHEEENEVKDLTEADYYQRMIFRLRQSFMNGVFLPNLGSMYLIGEKQLTLMR